MLPDYPELKKKLESLLLRRAISLRNQHLGVFSEIPRIRLFEGDQMVSDNNGKETHTEFRETSQEMVFRSGMGLKDMLMEWDKSAIEFAKKEGAFTTESLFKAIAEIGNTVEARGELKPEKWFELLEKIAIDFDEKGQPILPTIVVADEEVLQKISKCLDLIHTDIGLKKRYDSILENKRLKWNDREASRKLVD